MNEKGMKEIWSEIASFIRDETAKMKASDKSDYLDHVAVVFGTARRNLDNWIRNGIPDYIAKGTEKGTDTRSKIIKLHIFVSKYRHGDWRLASAISESLDMPLANFDQFKKYEGSYQSFRLGYDGLIEGTVNIENRNGEYPWMHYHKSKFSIEGQIEEFDHKGPLFYTNGRIYAAGIGHNERECYFRSMILKAIDRPKSNITFGIILTEAARSYLPIASKIALVSSDDTRVNNNSFKEKLAERLKIDSDINIRLD